MSRSTVQDAVAELDTHRDFRQDSDMRRERLDEFKVLRGLQSTDFLQAVTLLATRERNQEWQSGETDKPPAVSCRRSAILDLKLEEYQRWADEVERCFDWAAKFLNRERIFESRDVPYRTQLVPLAALHVALGSQAETIGAVQELRK